MTRFTSLLATAATCAMALPALAADKDLIILDWAGFEVDGLYQNFVAKHGDAPTFSLFGDDDEAFQKMASGFRADMVHPCSAMVPRYRDADLIEPWDESRLENMASISPEFLDSPAFRDDQGLWFLPSYWGATAIAYNTDQVPAEDVASIQVFQNPKYAGRVSLPDNTDDVWALAFLATGVTKWDEVNDEQFAAAAAWLRATHPNVYAYWVDPSEQTQQMASGAVLVSWSWNDGVALLREDGFPIGFQREPAEGSSTFVCGFVKAKNAPGSVDKAYDYVNDWTRTDAAAVLVDNLGYGHSNATGMAGIAAETLDEAGLGKIDAPTLAQVPVPPQLRDRMIEEFEKIKAGF